MARDITEPDDFAEELQALATAGPDDLVRLQIESIGGNIGTCVMLIKAIKACQASVIAEIGTECCSAASAIALACDGWEVDEMSTMMVHTASIQLGGGKLRNVEANAKHTTKMLERFIDMVYTGFLTKKEIKRIKRGEDLYLDGIDLAKKLENYTEYRKELDTQEQAA